MKCILALSLFLSAQADNIVPVFHEEVQKIKNQYQDGLKLVPHALRPTMNNIIRDNDAVLVYPEAYTTGNPLRIFVHGTDYSPQTAERVAFAIATQPPYDSRNPLLSFFWPAQVHELGATGLQRRLAGLKLARIIDQIHDQSPDLRTITCIGHSHGGNAITIASNNIQSNVKINAVLFGTPIKTKDIFWKEYTPNQQKIDTLINVVSLADNIQIGGSLLSQALYPQPISEKLLRFYEPSHAQNVYNIFVRIDGQWPEHTDMRKPEIVNLITEYINNRDKTKDVYRNLFMNIDTKKQVISHAVAFDPNIQLDMRTAWQNSDVGSAWKKWTDKRVKKIGQKAAAQELAQYATDLKRYKEQYGENILSDPKVAWYAQPFIAAAKAEQYIRLAYESFVVDVWKPTMEYLKHAFGTSEQQIDAYDKAFISALQQRSSAAIKQRAAPLEVTKAIAEHTSTAQDIVRAVRSNDLPKVRIALQKVPVTPFTVQRLITALEQTEKQKKELAEELSKKQEERKQREEEKRKQQKEKEPAKEDQPETGPRPEGPQRERF